MFWKSIKISFYYRTERKISLDPFVNLLPVSSEKSFKISCENLPDWKFRFALAFDALIYFKVEISLYQPIVYLHRKEMKRIRVKEKKNLFLICDRFSVQINHWIMVYFRELNCLPSSRFCDFVGSFSRNEERRNYRVHKIDSNFAIHLRQINREAT